jgi:DNA polymerase elongation subunit (family B)
MTVSYITETGGKALMRYNVNRFKSYVEDPSGKFENWNGKRCSVRMTDRPGWTEFKTFIEELPVADQKLLLGKTNPRLYTFDIECQADPKVFPEPGEAKFPILTVSVVNDKLDAIVLGTKPLNELQKLQQKYEDWLDKCEFYKTLNLPRPKTNYIHFQTEAEMLRYLLQNFVSKCPVMAGWNSLGFDWQYIQNRIKNYYPEISFNSCSIDWTMKGKQIQDMKGNKIRLNMPNHTLILDMMDIIGTYDMAVMPIKESLSLDYIATESIGVGKIKYDGDLQHLYETDYETYVFYNLIDSVLVQLIDKRFKTLSILYTQSLICRNDISTAFSKIKITESMFFNYFFEHGIKVVPSEKFSGERGELMGAYVRKTTPGKHQYVCCNDFASLYPSVIITCNLSIENYLGSTGDGTFTESQLEKYRKDPNYFVSVNGCVYKNDKDYSFKNIQWGLKKLRGVTKYLSKELDATVMTDIDHFLEKRKAPTRTYSDHVQKELEELGFPATNSSEITKYDLHELKRILKNEITFMTCKEQAIKLIMNSMYGGSSHVAFEWFNIYLANDITGEGRNLIHIMEKHIPKYFQDNWVNMKDLHTQLGIKLNITKSPEVINGELGLDNLYDKDLNILVQPVAGDTDSIYFCYEGLLKTIEGIDKMSITEKAKIVVGINEQFLNGHNKDLMTDYYRTRNIRNVDTDMVHEFELETCSYSELRLDVKKRYSQMLIFKDGKYFDEDHMKRKTKGLEMVKASFPAPARNLLSKIVEHLLLSESPTLIHELNAICQEGRRKWEQADIDYISPAISVNGYMDYIISDNDPVQGVVVKKGCPFQVRGLAYYNWIRQTKNLAGEPLYGGKMKYYIVRQRTPKKKTDSDIIFTFQPSSLPKWSEQYAPIDRRAMFQKCVLDPINRILTCMHEKNLNWDGHIDINLFDL